MNAADDNGADDNGTGGDAPGPLPAPRDDDTVTYSFPIEVIVVGALTEDDQRRIEERIWGRLVDALAQLG